jgi:two-component system CheB/CheR fusion protein
MTPIATQDGKPALVPSEAAPTAAESVYPAPEALHTSAKEMSGLRPADKFPVVALCGSAGALEAFERFFAYLPADSKLAIVVVLHRPPEPELEQSEGLIRVIQRFTRLPVAEVVDGHRLRPNHVFVSPAGHDLCMLHGSLYLLKPTQPAAQRHPIDFFLQTLAKDAAERAVCIICSGLGSDGTVGLKLVMENFGMVMVQAPETAAFDAMPCAAIATEFVDFVLSPELMAVQLLDYLERPLQVRPPMATRLASPATRCKKFFCSSVTKPATTLAFTSATRCFGASSGA